MSNGMVLIAFGGNLPFNGQTPLETMRAALPALSDAGLTVVKQSLFYVSDAYPAGAGPDYVNGVVACDAGGKPAADVLAALHGVEARFGRTRASRWAGRTLDLDLLAMGDAVLPDAATWAGWHGLSPHDQARIAPDRLILPHPRLQDRAFVLIPLTEIAPDWRHPVLGQTTTQLLAALSAQDRATVRILQ